MEVFEAIRTKRAIRGFKDQPLREEDIRTILDAARRAPSASNRQNWVFIAIRDKTVQRELSTTGPGTGHLANAPLAVAIVQTTPDVDPTLNAFDAGQAATYMELAAWELGIASNVAGIREQARAKAALGVPDEMTLRWAISFGYAADGAAGAPRKAGGRKPLEEVVRWDKWG